MGMCILSMTSRRLQVLVALLAALGQLCSARGYAKTGECPFKEGWDYYNVCGLDTSGYTYCGKHTCMADRCNTGVTAGYNEQGTYCFWHKSFSGKLKQLVFPQGHLMNRRRLEESDGPRSGDRQRKILLDRFQDDEKDN